MTFQTDRIQVLIAEIDEVLNTTKKTRLGWWKFGEVGQQRQLLEKVRHHLQNFLEELATTTQRSLLIDRIASLPVQPVDMVEPLASEQNQQNTPPELLQAVVQEMSYLRQFYEQATFLNLRQQYQGDLEVLQQKRQALLEEIQQLQQQRRLDASSQEGEAPRFSRETSDQTPESKNMVSDRELPQVTSNQILSSDPQKAITGLEIPLLYAGAELPSQMTFLPEQDSEQTPDNQESGDEENIDHAEDRIIPDTIASLTDLLEIVSSSDELVNESRSATTELELTEGANLTKEELELIPTTEPEANADTFESEVTENFISASVDEDLLPTAERQTNSNVDLWLGKNMLDQLSEDLSSLEGINLTEVPESNDILPGQEDLASQSRDSHQEYALNQEDLVVSNDLEATGITGATEIPCTIPEDILAEFDDLFGESAEKITPTSVWEENQTLEKKN